MTYLLTPLNEVHSKGSGFMTSSGEVVGCEPSSAIHTDSASAVTTLIADGGALRQARWVLQNRQAALARVRSWVIVVSSRGERQADSALGTALTRNG